LNIFYNKKGLSNFLVSWFGTSEKITSKIKIENGIIFKNEDQIVGFNLKINANDIPSGRLLLNSKLKDLIVKLLKEELILINNSGFKVGFVESCQQIPDTHLSNLVINLKAEKLNIVCGAQNIRKGLKVVIALPNTIISNGMFIKETKLKGFNSNGMVCSKKELLISDGFNNEGIIELPDSYQIGDFFKEAYQN